jgi:hypothetical protein
MEAINWKTATITEKTKGSGGGYCFTAESEVIGSLESTGWFGIPNQAATPYGEWELVREGFWRPDLIVRNRRTNAIVAECTRRWLSFEWSIRLADGPLYSWGIVGWWAGTYAICDPSGDPVLTVQEGRDGWSLRDLFRTNGRIEVSGTGEDPARLSLLGVLAWYFFLLHRQEASAVVVF